MKINKYAVHKTKKKKKIAKLKTKIKTCGRWTCVVNRSVSK